MSKIKIIRIGKDKRRIVASTRQIKGSFKRLLGILMEIEGPVK